MAKTRVRAKSAAAAAQATRTVQWFLRFPEVAPILLALAVPLALNRYSHNINDVKDAALGLGSLLGLAVWLVAGLRAGRLEWAPSRLTVLVWAYLIWAAIGITYSPFWYVSLSDFGRLAGGVGIFLLTIVTVRTAKTVRDLAFAASLAAILTALYAIAQYVHHEPKGVEWALGFALVALGAVGLPARSLGRRFALAGGGLLALGFLYLVMWKIGYRPVVLEWGDKESRIFSFAGNATYLGGYVLLLLPLLVAVGWPDREATSGRLIGWPTVFFGVTVVLLLAALALSFSFASVGGLVVGAAAAAVIKVVRGGRRALVKLVLWGIPAVLVLLPLARVVYPHLPAPQRKRARLVVRGEDPAGAERQLQWRAAWHIFREHPLVGEGYSAYRVAALPTMAADWYGQRYTRGSAMFTPNHAHHEYLQVLADSGLIGAALWFALLAGMLAASARVALRHPEAIWRRVALAILVAAVGFMFQNLFGVTFRVTACVMFFWLWLGLLVVAMAQLRNAEASKPGLDLRGRYFRPAPAVGVMAAGIACAAVWGGLAVVAIRPVVADVQYRWVQLRAKQGNYPAAIEAAQRTLALCPYSATTYYLLAYAQGQLGQYAEAVESSEAALRLMPGNASAYYNLGIAYRQWGKLDESAANLQKAVDLMPLPQNYVGLAETRLAQGQFTAAQELTEEAIRKEEGGGRDLTMLHGMGLLLADAYSRDGAYPQALQALDRAEAYLPGDPKVRSSRILLLGKANRVVEARQAAREWTVDDPNSGSAWATLGMLQLLGKDEAAAQVSLERAIALDPSQEQARKNLSMCYANQVRKLFNQKQYEQAKAVALKAVDLDPNSADMRYNLALCYLQLRDFARGREQLELILQRGGSEPSVQRARDLLARLTSP